VGAHYEGVKKKLSLFNGQWSFVIFGCALRVISKKKSREAQPSMTNDNWPLNNDNFFTANLTA
jgi:hypothetical protein